MVAGVMWRQARRRRWCHWQKRCGDLRVAMWGGMERGAVTCRCGHSLGCVDREDIGPLQWHFLQCELAPEKTIRWRAAVRTALTAATTGLVVVEAIVAC